MISDASFENVGPSSLHSGPVRGHPALPHVERDRPLHLPDGLYQTHHDPLRPDDIVRPGGEVAQRALFAGGQGVAQAVLQQAGRSALQELQGAEHVHREFEAQPRQFGVRFSSRKRIFLLRELRRVIWRWCGVLKQARFAP